MQQMRHKIFNICVLIIAFNVCVNAAATHKHDKHGSKERLKDGVYSPRDSHHNEGGEHHAEFDHEAIIGSVKEAEEFDTLPKEEAQKRLGVLVTKMDGNKDGYVDRHELKAWILRSFKKLAEEEADDHFEEIDEDNNEAVTWHEYLLYTYATDDENNASAEDSQMIENDKLMFYGADTNKDGKLTRTEFLLFQNPEESPEMLPLVLKQNLKERDSNGDEKIDFKEYVGEEATQHDKDWLLSERKEFDTHDKNKDGFLSGDEILSWVIPSNDEIASEEVDHLYASSDDDHDDRLSYKEIVDHHETFVGSDATDFGDQLEDLSRFDDEL